MADDNIKSSVIRRARVTTVKDGIEQVIYFQTDTQSVIDLQEKLVKIVDDRIDVDKIREYIYDNINKGNIVLPQYALLDSPVFVGTPKAPTPKEGDKSELIANTEFVNKEINTISTQITKDAIKKVYVDPTFTGTPKAPTAAIGVNTDQIATTKFVNNQIKQDLKPYALLDSPVFVGTPKAPTVETTSNDNSIATTAFVNACIANKQDTLVFDNTPLINSKNPVTSDGIYRAIQNIKKDFAKVAFTGKYEDITGGPVTATTATEGLVKLYKTVGTNSDGTMTQLSITNALNQKADASNLAKVATSGQFKDLNGIPIASDSTQGITKIYTFLGENTDGTMTQAAINASLNNYLKKSGGELFGSITAKPHANIIWKNDDGSTIGSIDGEKYSGTSEKAVCDSDGNKITTTYATKSELSVIPKFSIEIVDELPTKDISHTAIYLVSSKTPSDGDIYTEYVYTKENKWELLGKQKIDLSGYYSKEETNNLLKDKAPIASPSFTGNPTSITPDPKNNSTSIATTEYVTRAINAYNSTIVTEVGDDDPTENLKPHQMWVEITGDSDIK